MTWLTMVFAGYAVLNLQNSIFEKQCSTKMNFGTCLLLEFLDENRTQTIIHAAELIKNTNPVCWCDNIEQ